MSELDNFEQILQDGLLKICSMSGFTGEMLTSPDIEAKWEEFLKDYTADAVRNFADYPDAALGFAAFLGLAVATEWDSDWTTGATRKYSDYYGSRGFDNMDDHITDDLLRLSTEDAAKLRECLNSSTQAAMALMRHEGIDSATAYGFYAQVRCYCVMFRIGVTIRLHQLGYRKHIISDNGSIPS